MDEANPEPDDGGQPQRGGFECRQLLGNRYCRVEPIFPAGKSFPIDDVSKVVDLMDQATSFDLADTVAWLNASGW
jgi:hypothetical protein